MTTLREALLRHYGRILTLIAIPRAGSSDDATRLHEDAKQMEALLNRLGISISEVLDREVHEKPRPTEKPQVTPLRKKPWCSFW